MMFCWLVGLDDLQCGVSGVSTDVMWSVTGYHSLVLLLSLLPSLAEEELARHRALGSGGITRVSYSDSGVL